MRSMHPEIKFLVREKYKSFKASFLNQIIFEIHVSLILMQYLSERAS